MAGGENRKIGNKTVGKGSNHTTNPTELIDRTMTVIAQPLGDRNWKNTHMEDACLTLWKGTHVFLNLTKTENSRQPCV